MSRNKSCKNKYCESEPVNWGYCKQHLTENENAESRKSNALSLLQTGLVEDSKISSEKLETEFNLLLSFYNDACDVFQNRAFQSYIEKGEAEMAMGWSKGLAEIIYYDEINHRGAITDNPNEHFRTNLWERINKMKQRTTQK